jgi:hypothetical protein
VILSRLIFFIIDKHDCNINSGNKHATFKPKKQFGGKGTKRHDLHKYAKATLGSGNLRAAVQVNSAM